MPKRQASAGSADSSKAVGKNQWGINGIKPAASRMQIKPTATANRRRRRSVLRPSVIRSPPFVAKGTEATKGIPL